MIVAKSEHAPELYKKEMFVKRVNWISRKPSFPLRCKVKIRYLHPANPAIVKQVANDNLPVGKAGLQIVFDKKQRAITSGQSAVFYRKNEVLGGGIIA